MSGAPHDGAAWGARMDVRRAHFIGIAGAGMSATAKLLRDSGVVVTGSDEAAYPPVSDFLVQEGIDCRSPYDLRNIPADADIIVIGKNAKLVPEHNSEVAAAYASGKQVLSFPEVLGELSREKETVVVAGSFGKSTSAALLAHCLEAMHDKDGNGLGASFFIGALPLTPATNARLGGGRLFVMEGDEYPSSNTDPRSKFLHYRPAHLLVTPLAHDHVNVFPTPDDYLRPFEELVALRQRNATHGDGAVVVCTEGDLSGAFLSRLRHPVITYGLADGEFQAGDIVWGERTQFSLLRDGRAVARLETTQLGEHNVQNIVGVGALLSSLGLLSLDCFVPAVAGFRGVRRRLDRKSEKTTIPIFEGFGSSYDKARSAIAAMRRHFAARRLLVVFEPHTFSWRNRAMLHWYDDVFDGAEKVFVFEPASQGAATHAQVSQTEIVARVRGAGFDAEPLSDPEAGVARIAAELRRDDSILLLTSGDLGGLIERIPAVAEKAFPTGAVN
jgi:UDP-N-acetylmuramate: L-alanyl-gamma-D-glutamyl-meso-diaminopimelate ligase